MPILAQLNPIRFYANKISRQWENTENKKSFIVTYPMFLDGQTLKCKVPPFNVIVPSDPQSTHTFSMKVYDCDGNEVYSSTSYFSIGNENYTQIGFVGDNVELDESGYYEIKLTIDGVDYWSDFFEWNDDLDDKLKVKVESSKITLGRNPQYKYDTFYTTHEFYLPVEPITSNTYLKEEANETDAATDINYGSSALLRYYKVQANEPIFMFLRALRIFTCNGEVTFTHKFIDYKAIDIVAEIDGDNGTADLIEVKIEFKVDSEIVSVYNG